MRHPSVPENPQTPEGRLLSLGILIAPRTADTPAKEALFVLAGGPGAAATPDAEFFLEMLRPLRATHDVVLLNQRGTAGAGKMHCDIADGHFFVPRDPAGCLAHLSERADLRAYTTEFFVGDIEAARSALGYERISLWGGSYGTRAAFVYAKRYPDRVRSLVLVAPAPMSMPILESFEEDGRAALDALVADCLTDTSCARAFPGLRADLRKLREQLADPFHQLGVQLLQYSSTTSRFLPLLISLAADGRGQHLESAIEQQRSALLSQLSIGLHLAVFCNEDYPFPAPGQSKPSAMRAEYEAACRGWPRAVLPADFRAASRIDTPALIITGEWDPVTSPRWGRVAGEQFSRSQIVVVPKSGHMLARLAPCLGAMTAEFLDRGAAGTSCVARADRPPYAIRLPR